MKNLSYLDKLRHYQGTYKVKASVKKLGETNRKKLIYYLNDKKMSFSTLFILLPEMDRLNIYKELSQRNKVALRICAQVMQDEALREKITMDTDKAENSDEKHFTLKWMFATGYKDDGLNDKFDEVLDATVALLIKTYKDKTILPNVAEMIFKRHRKGLFKHDLIWAFFESHDPYTLRLIANYLRSREKKDVQLASQLLNYNISEDVNSNKVQPHSYQSYLLWLKENYSFIYYTGESYQLTAQPSPWRVNLGKKYLCEHKPQGENRIAAQEKEQRALKDFDQLNDNEKLLLSDFSYKLHKRNIYSWKKWMASPVDKQIESAKKGLGGMTR